MHIKEKLADLGFFNIGNWGKNEKNQLFYELNQLSKIENILYAFITNDELLYIGKTTRNIENRLKGYIKPCNTQTTNIRNNANLIKLLDLNSYIEIWLFEDKGLMTYGGFRVSLAAGLEDSLIKELKPKWNGVRLSNICIDRLDNIQSCVESVESQHGVVSMPIYHLRLSPTYYNWKCINIGKNYSKFLGEHGDKIEIFVGNSKTPLEVAKIDRNANSGDSVRIRPAGSTQLKSWFHKHFKLNQTVQILIESPNGIRFLKNT